MIKTAIGASLPEDLFKEFIYRVQSGFPGGKTGLIKESLRGFFEANPLDAEQKKEMDAMKVTGEGKKMMWNIDK